MDPLASAIGSFAFDLFRKLLEANPTRNIFFSPASISTAMAMVLLGARGDTAAQVAKTFRFDGLEDLHSQFQSLNAELNKSDAHYILKVANRLYGEKSCTFLQDFLTNIQKRYGAELSAVDFQNAAPEVRNEINQWVEEQTEGKILDLLPEGSLSEMTKLVLVNAVYFKARWDEQFMEEFTEEKPFKLNKNETKTVTMMYMLRDVPFRWIPDRKYCIMELPYKGEELSMVLLMPLNIEDNTTGLEKLEQELTLAKLEEWTDPDKVNDFDGVHVHLPKFKLEETYDLKSYLSALGLLDVFDSSKADLSGMSGSPDLHLSEMVHKSFIEVSEVGEEGPAERPKVYVICSFPLGQFKADHPFLFFIRHNATRTILFMGRVVSP